MRLRRGPRGVQLSAGPHNTEFERTAPSLRKINEPDGSVGGFGNAFAVPPLNSTFGGRPARDLAEVVLKLGKVLTF